MVDDPIRRVSVRHASMGSAFVLHLWRHHCPVPHLALGIMCACQSWRLTTVSSAGDRHGGRAGHSQRHLWGSPGCGRQCRHDQPGAPLSVFPGLRTSGRSRQQAAVCRRPSHVHDFVCCALFESTAAFAQSRADQDRFLRLSCHVGKGVAMFALEEACIVGAAGVV